MSSNVTLSDHEKILISLGAKRYRQKLEQLEEKKLAALTDYGSNLISSNLDKVASCLTSDILPVSTQAYIGLATIINFLQPEQKATVLALKIGNAVIQEFHAQDLKLDPKLSRRKIVTKLREYKPEKIEKNKIIRIGTDILNAIESKAKIIKYEYKYINNKRYRVCILEEDFEKHYEGFLRHNLNLEPLRKPITAFPIPVNDELIGGYAFDVLNNKSSLQYRTKDQLDAIASSDSIEHIKGVLNSTQSIPYSIDEKVYQTASLLFSEGIAQAGIPAHTSDLPEYGTTKEERKIYFQAKERANSLKGKRYNMARTLGIAEELLSEHHCYMPCYLDFRGRLYYRGDYLNPQGNDLSKALLQFTSKAPIDEEVKFFYYVHGANCYGADKLSYQDRYQFIEKKENEIKLIAQDPIKHLNLWKDCDSPFSYLAFCFDCAAYLDDPENYESGLRIASDASSSGLQILSLLLRDHEGCVRTNVLDNGSQVPSDVYIECLQVLKVLLEQDANSTLQPVSGYAKYWLNELKGKNSRNLVKRILMTSVYSLSRYGLNKYVQEWINEHRPPNTDDYVQVDKYLKTRVAEAVNDTVKGATLGMEWFKKVAKTLAMLNKDIELDMPTGFRLVSRYRKSKAKQVRTVTQGKFLYVSYSEETDVISQGKSVNASVPNIIHALDAAILYDIVESIPNNIPFSLVHDSVYYRAADANLFYEQIRESIKNLFSFDIMSDFKEQIEEQHKIPLPDLPVIGNLNFEEILESPYIYH